MKHLLTTSMCVAFLVCQSSQAQTASVQSGWQFSLDDGQSWVSGDTFADQGQTSVRARLIASVSSSGFPTGNVPTLSSARYEVTSTALGQGGLNDVVASNSTLGFRSDGISVGLGAITTRSSRWSAVLKTAGNALQPPTPPGTGPGMLFFNWYTGFSAPWSSATVVMFEYQIDLDGLAGSRQFSAFFLPQSSSGAANQATVGQAGPTPLQVTADVVHVPATLIVVPSPGVGGLVVAMGFVVGRHRRR
jgi:hypothetical protein